MESFNEKLAELKRLRKELINKENNLQDNMKKEKNDANKAIEDKYIPEIEKTFSKIQESEEKIDEFNEEIVRCSTFDLWDIVSIMKEIIKIYEGENYIYNRITYTRDSKRNISSSFAKVLFSDNAQGYLYYGPESSAYVAPSKAIAIGVYYDKYGFSSGNRLTLEEVDANEDVLCNVLNDIQKNNYDKIMVAFIRYNEFFGKIHDLYDERNVKF